MDPLYPKSPESVPPALTQPSASYRKHAWLAVLGLLLFILSYFSLAAWFSYASLVIIQDTIAGVRPPLWGYLLGGCSAFLGLFMLKALVFFKHSSHNADFEVQKEQEPQLFNFLHQLAEETGAPKPHRVFLSPRVNASVSYDLSFMNFFFSSKKNLEIGLPLVNALNLGELKAVLAHEFGHFAQKSMSVGRWVYVAHQVASHIISKRDFLDKLLNMISNFDLRVAWIGWLMSLIVWSIRAVMDTLFAIVVIAQRALSREMEFQADLVAVSVTGSDALIHALYKLQSADESWERALSFANAEVNAKRSVQNLFEVQTKVTEKLRFILDDPNYGYINSERDVGAEKRLFTRQLASPPKMWSTHPENTDREENAKQHYIAAPIDQRSSWSLFSAPIPLQQQITHNMLDHLECEKPAMEITLHQLDEYYNCRFLNPAYKGSYLGRELSRHVNDPSELYDMQHHFDIAQQLKEIYPKSLTEDLQKLRHAYHELNGLIGLQRGYLKTNEKVIRHNGNEYQQSELPDLIEQQNKDVASIESRLQVHDKTCRSVHIQAANTIDAQWGEYLIGLIHTLHYAEHSVAEVQDIRGLLNNVLAIAFADGKVSSRELKGIIQTGKQACEVLAKAYESAKGVTLDQSLLKRLEINSWSEAVGDFTLPHPTQENINDWMQAIDSWFDVIINAFNDLRRQSLEQLLTTEAYLAHKWQSPHAMPMEYGVSQINSEYTKLIPGNERKLQTRLGLWDRFQTADGIFGTISRLLVAGTIVGSVLWYSVQSVLFKI